GGVNRLAAPMTFHVRPNLTDEQKRTLRQTEDAIELWLKTRASPPDRAQGLVWRGRIREIAAHQAEAIRDLREALELIPEHFEGNAHLAIFLSQEAPEETCRRLEALAGRSPDDPRILYPLATAQHSLGRLDEAESVLARLV